MELHLANSCCKTACFTQLNTIETSISRTKPTCMEIQHRLLAFCLEAGFCRPYLKTSIQLSDMGRGASDVGQGFKSAALLSSCRCRTAAQAIPAGRSLRSPLCPLCRRQVDFEVRSVAESRIPEQWARGPKTALEKRRAAKPQHQRLIARPKDPASCP